MGKLKDLYLMQDNPPVMQTFVVDLNELFDGETFHPFAQMLVTVNGDCMGIAFRVKPSDRWTSQSFFEEEV